MIAYEENLRAIGRSETTIKNEEFVFKLFSDFMLENKLWDRREEGFTDVQAWRDQLQDGITFNSYDEAIQHVQVIRQEKSNFNDNSNTSKSSGDAGNGTSDSSDSSDSSGSTWL